jgi:hypothetical protein
MLTNLANTKSPNFGSGRISLLGADLLLIVVFRRIDDDFLFVLNQHALGGFV